MTDLEIVEADWKKNHSEYSLEQCIAAYRKVVEMGQHRFKHGQTLLFIRSIDDGSGIFHFVNAARFDDFVVNVKDCLQQAKTAGFDHLTTYFANPRIIDVAKQSGVSYTLERKEVGGIQQYLMTLRL